MLLFLDSCTQLHSFGIQMGHHRCSYCCLLMLSVSLYRPSYALVWVHRMLPPCSPSFLVIRGTYIYDSYFASHSLSLSLQLHGSSGWCHVQWLLPRPQRQVPREGAI
jgi:hypothetical protein